ncbi:hypothetical protein ACFFX0_06375 [Citricoccus parietis]|uniref:Uncharacterized protein n=1 Tax=Citricoccus parietis TaxID=592307 RepID=A0ABV5FW31_9MICC
MRAPPKNSPVTNCPSGARAASLPPEPHDAQLLFARSGRRPQVEGARTGGDRRRPRTSLREVRGRRRARVLLVIPCRSGDGSLGASAMDRRLLLQCRR